MPNVKESVTIDASPDVVWSLVGDPAEISGWHPFVDESSVEDGIRYCALSDGSSVKETILSHSDTDRSYTFDILESAIPFTDYVCTISVAESAGGGSELTIQSRFKVPEGDPDGVEAMIGEIYRNGLAAVAERFAIATA